MNVTVPHRLLCLVAFAGCIQSLDPKDVVAGPRVLDILADRPEINPGQSTTLRVLLAGTQATPSFRWYACLSADAARNPSGLANFGESNAFAGCFGPSGMNVPLGSEATATFVAPRNALTSLETLAARFGSQLPPGVASAIARDIGIVVGVGVEVTVDGQTINAYKRVVISLNPRTNTNPPSPRFQLDGSWVSVRSGEDMQCVREDGMPLRVTRGQRVNFAPDADQEQGAESYRVLTASGQLVDRQETFFYSWYATTGRMGQQLTRSPIRNNFWGSPAVPGDASIWVLTRDGHGGTSGCKLDVRVE
jgi:hypothetical protein